MYSSLHKLYKLYPHPPKVLLMCPFPKTYIPYLPLLPYQSLPVLQFFFNFNSCTGLPKISFQHSSRHVPYRFLCHILPILPHDTIIGYTKPYAYTRSKKFIIILFRYNTLYGSNTILIKKPSFQELVDNSNSFLIVKLLFFLPFYLFIRPLL